MHKSKAQKEICTDYSIDDTSKILACARSTVYSLIKYGQLECYKIGRATRIKFESVEKLRNGGKGHA